jgi:hypothetical protein
LLKSTHYLVTGANRIFLGAAIFRADLFTEYRQRARLRHPLLDRYKGKGRFQRPLLR